MKFHEVVITNCVFFKVVIFSQRAVCKCFKFIIQKTAFFKSVKIVYIKFEYYPYVHSSLNPKILFFIIILLNEKHKLLIARVVNITIKIS